jgi:hypothetical protein
MGGSTPVFHPTIRATLAIGVSDLASDMKFIA